MQTDDINVIAKINCSHEIFFVYDDQSLCTEISEVLVNNGVNVRCFTNASDCIKQLYSMKCNLLISNYQLPEMSGIELMKEAKRVSPWLPVLIITDNGDIPKAVSIIRAGAEDVLEKPLNIEILLSKINTIYHNFYNKDSSDISSLTKMERQIFSFIMQGKNNKEIAFSMNRSKRTIENHRARLMKKLGAHNVAELFKNASQLGLVDFS